MLLTVYVFGQNSIFLGYLATFHWLHDSPPLSQWRNEHGEVIYFIPKQTIPSIQIVESTAYGDKLRELRPGASNNFLVVKSADPRLQGAIVCRDSHHYWWRLFGSEWGEAQEEVFYYLDTDYLRVGYPDVMELCKYILLAAGELGIAPSAWPQLFQALIQPLTSSCVGMARPQLRSRKK